MDYTAWLITLTDCKIGTLDITMNDTDTVQIFDCLQKSFREYENIALFLRNIRIVIR